MTGRSTAQRRGRRGAEIAEKRVLFFWGVRQRLPQGALPKKKYALSLRVLCASAPSALCSLLTWLVMISCMSATTVAQEAPRSEWIQLFNGKDLTDWIPKIAKHDVGDNFGNTFRVENGVLRVAYDKYEKFDNQFGHLFYKDPFSYYHLVVEYRFVGNWLADTPEWAYRNSGAMLHSQDPKTMPRNQDFPISIEFQFLGGLSDGKTRSTGNMCSPGTDVFINAAMARGHCVNSTSKTYDGDQWVKAEAIVLGDSLMKFIVNGDTVLSLTKPTVGGGNVSGFDPAAKQNGKPLTSGYVSLQSEGHAIEFRRVELLKLSGCMDPGSLRYRNYFVMSEPAACKPDE
jgi:hypothetical protein